MLLSLRNRSLIGKENVKVLFRNFLKTVKSLYENKLDSDLISLSLAGVRRLEEDNGSETKDACTVP